MAWSRVGGYGAPISLSPYCTPTCGQGFLPQPRLLLPSPRLAHTFLRPFVLAFPSPFSSFMIPEWLPMALRVVSSQRLFYISGVGCCCIWPRSTHDNNTSDPMTVIGCLHAPYLLLGLTSGPKRHLVGAKAHWRSPSLLAQALTPPRHTLPSTPYHGSPSSNHCRTWSSCAKQPKVIISPFYALTS